MTREYDEATCLMSYIFRWHGNLIPDEEKYPTAGYFRKCVPSASPEDIDAILNDDESEVSTPEIEAALLAAWDQFNVALCNKILDEHKLVIRRCPQCNRILESPMAKLCIWCDYNEYKPEG